MKDFITFVKSKTFLKHLSIALVILFIIIWCVFKWLNFYTHHGETYKVPDFTGIKISELNGFVNGKNVRYTIIDSIYDPKGPKGVVVRQNPEKNSQVKDNRTIYLYVSCMLAPQVIMPKLKSTSLRQAYSILQTYGLKMGKKTLRADECNNCVLEQMVHGKRVEPGTLVPKGTYVDLIIGKGLTGEKVKVPYLIGLTWTQAQEKLADYSLSEGGLQFDQPADSAKARIYKQIPGSTEEATYSMGGIVDLFFTNNFDKISIKDSTKLYEIE